MRRPSHSAGARRGVLASWNLPNTRKGDPMKIAHAGGALAALLFSGAVIANDAPVVVNVEGLQPRIAAQVQKHAAEGERSLARYLERVRPYQRLSYDELS